MKIDSNYKLREVCGETVALATGAQAGDMTKVACLGGSAKDIWQALWGKEFEVEDIVGYLLDHYNVDAETARKDATEWVEQMKYYGLLEGIEAAAIEQQPTAEAAPVEEAPKKRGLWARIIGSLKKIMCIV